MIDEKYKGIIGMEHHTSPVHPRMPMSSRAAQFAPFAALSGFEDVIYKVDKKVDEADGRTD